MANNTHMMNTKSFKIALLGCLGYLAMVAAIIGTIVGRFSVNEGLSIGIAGLCYVLVMSNLLITVSRKELATSTT